MKYLFCILIGYLLGCLSPSALVAKITGTDLRRSGTKNLGSTNVSLVIGKWWGLFVMAFDIMKSYLACKIATHLVEMPHIGLVVGLFAVAGHVFPFYMNFKGGKGLAPYAGLVLAYNHWIFLFLLVTCTALLIILNHGYVMSYSAAILFCIISTALSRDLWVLILTATAGALIMWRHRGNVRQAHEGTDMNVREYVAKLFKKKSKSNKKSSNDENEDDSSNN